MSETGAVAPAVEPDSFPLGLIEVDADRRVVAANPEAGAVLRIAPEELVGRALGDLVAVGEGAAPPEWARDWHPSAALRSVRRIPEHPVTLRCGDGGEVEATVAGQYRRSGDGRLQGALLVIRPTHRRGFNPPSGIEVISTVSHELRSPLTSVKGYTSLLLNRWERLKEEQKRMMLEQVHHDADRVTRLVNELLDISRLETGRLVLRRQLVDVGEIATRVVSKLALEYPDLDCTVELPEGFPAVYADPDKVEQVLTNLVENAAKYASPRDVHITGEVDGDDVAVAVHDRGEGIPASDLVRIFTKFFRRDHGKPTGSGLGLWISRGLVEAHGGRLTAESEPGHGSVFRFTLPLDAFDALLEHERPRGEAS